MPRYVALSASVVVSGFSRTSVPCVDAFPWRPAAYGTIVAHASQAHPVSTSPRPVIRPSLSQIFADLGARLVPELPSKTARSDSLSASPGPPKLADLFSLLSCPIGLLAARLLAASRPTRRVDADAARRCRRRVVD